MKAFLVFAFVMAAAPAFAVNPKVTKGLALIVASANVADIACPTVKKDPEEMALAVYKFVRNGGKEGEFKRELNASAAIVLGTVDKEGREGWCTAAWDLMGPNGVFHFLKRR